MTEQTTGARAGLSAEAAGTVSLGAGRSVNRLGFGAMRITGPGIWGEPRSGRGASRCCGAPSSSASTSSTPPTPTGRSSARSLSPRRSHPTDGLVIATKAGLSGSGPGPGAPTGGRSYLRQQLRGEPAPPEARAYRPLPAAPDRPEGAARGVGRRAGRAAAGGKIRHIGVSNVTSSELEQAREDRDRRVGAEPLQPRRPHAEDVLDDCAKRGHRLHPVVSAGGRRPRPAADRSTRSRASTRRRRRRSRSPGCLRARR